MDFLEGVGEFMAREGILELEILDGDRVIRLRRGSLEKPPPGEQGDTTVVRAPMAGILRLTPLPGQAPYAPAGETRKEREVLFCIEAMKHLNEVRADGPLLVEVVLVKDGDTVQEGQAVMRVRMLSREMEEG
ncbi:MAG: hypothetical protein QME88_10670 [Actinomycetota bacterium]|nr:hypothetical protein [Actinomycetota bacterium]